MPSVGMRLTTRVFGIVKGADGARVLRSGRRLWPDSDDVKCFRRGSGGRDEWLRILGNRGNGDGAGGGACKKKVWDNKSKEEDNTVMDIGDHHPPEVVPEPVNAQVVDKMWGLVYTRKRKRLSTPQYPALPVLKEVDSVKRYGIYFTRRQRRRTNDYENGDSKLDLTGKIVSESSVSGPVLAVLGESPSIPSFLAYFLNYVLRHMNKARVRLTDLSAFLSTEPMALVYSSHGIRFSQVLPATGTSMICTIYRPRQFTPMFTVDFSAVPRCFIYMHSSMFLKNNWQPSVLVYNSMVVDTGDSILDDDVVNRRAALFLSNFHSSKLSSQGQHRNSFNLSGIQKKRSSLRSRRSVWGSLGVNVLERSFAMVRFPQDAGSSCSANILVTESEKCYRDEGAKVVLEMSSSGEWCLTVKKDRIVRYSHRAQSVLRSWTCNRVNHAIIWTANSDWKLEFPSRQDWAIFKDLYKECSDRNVPLSPNLKPIPIPGVHEVLDYEDSNRYASVRPNSYIKLNNNEVERVLAKRTAIYDMDSEDEEWLKKFNNDVVLGDGIDERVLDDNFELMVDAFEKTLYCRPDDCFDENAAINLCLDLGRREVVQAVYNYWLRKRKLKRSSLIRIFQAHQQKKASPVTRSVHRKRRSSKRHAKQYGRGKQPNVLKAIAAQRAADLEYQNATRRVEEAKASLERCNEIALRKRKRAQALMEYADLATYKATMAVRIADTAQLTDSVDVSCTHFLD